MSVASKKAPARGAELLAIPAHERFHEILGGELVQKAMPSARHGSSQANLAGRLVGPYGRREGGAVLHAVFGAASALIVRRFDDLEAPKNKPSLVGAPGRGKPIGIVLSDNYPSMERSAKTDPFR